MRSASEEDGRTTEGGGNDPVKTEEEDVLNPALHAAPAPSEWGAKQGERAGQARPQNEAVCSGILNKQANKPKMQREIPILYVQPKQKQEERREPKKETRSVPGARVRHCW